MTPEVGNKINQEANWRSTDGHGAVNELTHHNFTQGAEYGYRLGVEDKDNFAIGFAAWSTHHPDAQRYKEAGITAYALLQKYISRGFVDNDTSKQ